MYFEADILPIASLKTPISVLNMKTFLNAHILKKKMMHYYKLVLKNLVTQSRENLVNTRSKQLVANSIDKFRCCDMSDV